VSSRGREIVAPAWNGRVPPSLESGDVVRFADLRQAIAEGRDLAGVTLFGCRLNGISFRGSRVDGLRLVGCFASELGAPMNFGTAVGKPEIVNSHLGRPLHLVGTRPGWPEPVAAAAWRLVNGDNVERHDAALQLGSSGFPGAAPLLASALTDEEWDVRAAALQALGDLRGSGFPDDDRAIVRFAARRLGDGNSLVEMHAMDFVRSAGTPVDLLVEQLRATASDTNGETLLRLRTAITLSQAGDPGDVVAQTFNPARWLHLLDADDPTLRSEYLHALGAANLDLPAAWQRGLTDPDPQVRAATLSALRLLDTPPRAELIEPLLADASEDVRIEAIFTLAQAAGYDPRAVRNALHDPSPRVRRYAATLLRGEA
jgi:hypothetical protein